MIVYSWFSPRLEKCFRKSFVVLKNSHSFMIILVNDVIIYLLKMKCNFILIQKINLTTNNFSKQNKDIFEKDWINNEDDKELRFVSICVSLVSMVRLSIMDHRMTCWTFHKSRGLYTVLSFTSSTINWNLWLIHLFL